MTYFPILGGLAVLGFYGHFSTPSWRSWHLTRQARHHVCQDRQADPSETLINRQGRHTAMCRRIGDLGASDIDPRWQL